MISPVDIAVEAVIPSSSTPATIATAVAVPELLARNKCPDFVTDRGHYFGTNLSDEDKRALIEFVKSF